MRSLKVAARMALIATLCGAAVACNAQTSRVPPLFSLSSKTINALQHAAILGNPSLLPDCDETKCSPGTVLLVKAVDERIHGDFTESNRYARECARSRGVDEAFVRMMCARILFGQIALTSGYGLTEPALRSLIRATDDVCAHGIDAKMYPNVQIDCTDKGNQRDREMLSPLSVQPMAVGAVRPAVVPLIGDLRKRNTSPSGDTWWPLLGVRVNGVPLHMIVDTGSSMTMLSADVVRKLGTRTLPAFRVHLKDISATSASHHLVNVRSMQVAGVKFANVQATVLTSVDGMGIDGIIGLNVLEKLGSFAFHGNQFEIHPIVPPNSTCVPMTIGSSLADPDFRLMLGDARFNGHLVSAVLDTGSLETDATMTPYFVRTHHRQPSVSRRTDVTSTNGSYRVARGHLVGRLRVLGKTYASPVAYTGSERGLVDVVVGARAVAQGEVSVDLRAMRACRSY